MASGGQFQSPDDNREHMFRLQILIIDGGLLVFRNIVDKTLTDKSMTLSACLNNEKSSIDKLKKKGIIKQVQYDILFPSGKNQTTTDMDITLLIFLLSNLDVFYKKSIEQFSLKNPPPSTDVTVAADIYRLRIYRNQLSHMASTTEIKEKEFKKMWTEIEQILVRRSSPDLKIQKTIAGYKTCPLDQKTVELRQDEMKKWGDFEAKVCQLDEKVSKLQTGQYEHGKRITDLENKVKTEKTEEEEYEMCKRKFQGDLIEFCRKRCSSIPLSPLLEEIKTPLAGFYVMPDIVAVKKKSLTCHEEERTPMKSLKDLFSTGSADQQEIYLTADAGFGKTAFSKYLAITWCQAHRPDEQYDVNKCFKDNELKALSKFEFLFLVFLRDHTSLSHIDDMITQQFSLHLPSLKSLDVNSCRAKLNEVLSREKCLLILDGLNEWTHPYNNCSEVTEQIPHRCVRDNCVILTTTQPWKLGVSNLARSQINQKVELAQLSEDSMLKLEENAIRKMTGVNDDSVLKSKTQDFNRVIRKLGLEHMQVIPLLLMYILCLWCNNIPIGNSIHEVYTNIVEFLLSRMSKKHPEFRYSRESSASEIPEYFKSHKYCKKFYSLITSLAELAYKILFNENRENTLVFDRTVAEKYLKAYDMTLSLHSGILSESRSETLIQEIIKVSFSHKTVQEFFAAIFISSQSYDQKIVLEKCRSIQDILDMSKLFEFISGMNADRICAISNDLMSVINEDEKTRDYRTRTGDKKVQDTRLYDIQKMFMSCLQEMPESENIQLYLQDFFIDNNTVYSEQLQRLLKQNKTKIKSLHIDRKTSSSLREIIDLFSLTDLSHIQKLYYEGDMEKEAVINRILFPSLQYVTLRCGTWTNDEENVSENLSRVQNLQYLYIECFTLSFKILETFFNFIPSQKSMKGLTLKRLYCTELGRHDCKRLNLDLSKHSILSELELREFPRLQLDITAPLLVNVTLLEISLDESSMLLSRHMLNIKVVELEKIEISARSLQNFLTVLENLPQSVTVKMRDIKPETKYDRVRENIRRRSQTFHVMQDNWRRFEFKTKETIKPS